MPTLSPGSADVDAYIATFSGEVRHRLERLRATVREAAPEAQETIKYRMPTFTLHGNLVHFAAFKSHIGFYPAPSGIDAFREELAAFQGAKGSLRFPLDEPLPLDLVSRIVRFRVRESRAAAARPRRDGSVVQPG